MATATPALLRLPDELLEAIVFDIPAASDVAAFSRTCKQAYKVTCNSKLWKQHCLDSWQHWNEDHKLAAKLEQPHNQTNWRRLYAERAEGDRETAELFNDLVAMQKGRHARMEQIAARRYDAKDLLLQQKYKTPDAAPDVLARRYWARATLDRLHRGLAVETWMQLPRRQPLELEDALGAFDIFVLSGDECDLGAIGRKLDDIAKRVKSAYAEKMASQEDTDDREAPDFGQLTTRQKAVEVADVLRRHRWVGKPDGVAYHALRNNFIGVALFGGHSSLPLQSAAIYCAVARRLGIEARPSNYPQHVYVMVQAPPGRTLNGEPAATDSAPERMYMNPWETTNEVSVDLLREGLAHRGIPPGEYTEYLGPANTFEMTFRTIRNLGTSLEQAQRGAETGLPGREDSMRADAEAAMYAMFWAMFILGDAHPTRAASERRRYLGYLLDHFEAEYPQDIGLLETVTAALLSIGPEREALTALVGQARRTDQLGKPAHPRGPDTTAVRFRIGQYFRHRRYGYVACIVGWDPQCSASPAWMEQMGVRELPRGPQQPFYHVIVHDTTTRYVAEENIEEFTEEFTEDDYDEVKPPLALMQLAGRYFKRWDKKAMMFVSNIREEYPDD